ncbi:TRAP transporter large permease subunit [Clostridium sp. MCC353]|uniref:TRAP transporter large permease n=1 Tax=Clostridium sp. MCC353 TaxID=2592646 RepID=UPI001C010F36|nr:TRAP transporter large permease [Clostridium sp. MCC353]MBT9777932.1 TRAP transporter large permease subunit [Clostridium sp. MCC353]
MYVGALFIIFMLLLVLSMPVAFAMASAGGFTLLLEGVDLIGAVPRVFSGMNSMSLLAIPFFLLSGSLMEYGGISKQLVAFAKALVGHLTGGLAHVCVLSSMIFASVSGSSVASAMAFGNILVPAMNKSGYDKGFTSTIQACGGTLGPIIPPSIVMIMYCSITGISVGAMFMAGFIPGILIGIGLMIVSYVYAKKAGIPKEEKVPAGEVWKAFKGAVWALFMPVIIVGGILSGLFTATESGMIAVVYGIFIGKVIYKELEWKALPKIFVNTALASAKVLFVSGMANILGWELARLNFPTMVIHGISRMTENKWIIMLLIIGLFMLVGCFVETVAAIVIFIPVLYPLAAQFGFEPIHFAIVVILTLVMGQVTPPVGVILFLTSSMNGISIKRTFRYLLPCLAVFMAVIFICAFVPDVPMLLPRLFYGV